MPSTVALLPCVCPSTPVAPEGIIMHFLIPWTCCAVSMASCPHLSSSTCPSPGLQPHNHLKISPNSSWTLLSFSIYLLLKQGLFTLPPAVGALLPKACQIFSSPFPPKAQNRKSKYWKKCLKKRSPQRK